MSGWGGDARPTKSARRVRRMALAVALLAVLSGCTATAAGIGGPAIPSGFVERLAGCWEHFEPASVPAWAISPEVALKTVRAGGLGVRERLPDAWVFGLVVPDRLASGCGGLTRKTRQPVAVWVFSWPGPRDPNGGWVWAAVDAQTGHLLIAT